MQQRAPAPAHEAAVVHAERFDATARLQHRDVVAAARRDPGTREQRADVVRRRAQREVDVGPRRAQIAQHQLYARPLHAQFDVVRRAGDARIELGEPMLRIVRHRGRCEPDRGRDGEHAFSCRR